MLNEYDEFDLYMVPKPSCEKCDEIEEKKYSAQEYFKSVLTQLYSEGTLNLIDLENDLDELCYYLDVKPVPGDLLLERKRKESAHKQFITFMQG